MTKKDPTKEALEMIADYAFFKPTARKEMNEYLEKERKSQIAAGIIEEGAEKINLKEANKK